MAPRPTSAGIHGGEYGNDFGKAEIVSAVNAMVHKI
jgi:hypothetical protein